MKFSTRGDKGKTSLLDGRRVPKYHLRPEVYGTIDEASAALGVARALTDNPRLKEIIREIQKDFITIGAELACPEGKEASHIKRIDENSIKRLTALLNEMVETVPERREFALPGEDLISAQLHVARTVVRRGERLLALLKSREKTLNPLLLAYLNRLADLLFVLALWEEENQKAPS